MITAVHTLIYSDDPVATRAFLRDVLGWPFVGDPSSGDGWLIFKSGPSEMGVHPTSGTWEGGTYEHARHHEVSFMCDDVVATRAELEAKGAEFVGDIDDRGYGLVTMMVLPGAGALQLYQPRHPKAYELD